MHHTNREALFLRSFSPQSSPDAESHPTKRHVRARFFPVKHHLLNEGNVLKAADPNSHTKSQLQDFARIQKNCTKGLVSSTRDDSINEGTRSLDSKEYNDTILLHMKNNQYSSGINGFWRTDNHDYLLRCNDPGKDSRQNNSSGSVASSIHLEIYEAFASMQRSNERAKYGAISPLFEKRLPDSNFRERSSLYPSECQITQNLLSTSGEPNEDLHESTDTLKQPPRKSRRERISRFFNISRRNSSPPFLEKQISWDTTNHVAEALPSTQFVTVREREYTPSNLLSFWCGGTEDILADSSLTTQRAVPGSKVSYEKLAKLNYFDPLAPVSHIRRPEESITGSRQLIARRTLTRFKSGTSFWKTRMGNGVEENITFTKALALRVKVNPQWEAEQAAIDQIIMARASGIEENDYGERRFGTRYDHSDWYRESQVQNYYEKNRV